MRLPESQLEDARKAMKWRRWNVATHDSGKVRPDFRPINVLKAMKFEVAIVCFGIFMGLMLPRMQRAMTASRAGP